MAALYGLKFCMGDHYRDTFGLSFEIFFSPNEEIWLGLGGELGGEKCEKIFFHF